LPTWNEWLATQKLEKLLPLPPEILASEWNPTEEDRNAAWDLYTELRTRVTTQPLHYRAGDMATALKSVYDLFAMTRELMHKYQRKCSHFATLSVFLLNGVVRPFTAKWHKIKEAGGLGNEDTCHDFRLELQELRKKLLPFQQLMGVLALGAEFRTGSEGGIEEQHGPSAIGPDIFSDGLLGITNAEIWPKEAAEVLSRRRTVLDANSGTENLVGMALSGGGIRSATFALGVVERLAEKGHLAHIDYLSTVSGGGYLGAFISSFLSSNRPDVGPNRNQSPFVRDSQVESAALRHLRNHSKYLIEGSRIARLRVIGQVVYGIFANLLIVCPFILLLATATVALEGEEIKAALESSLKIQLSPILILLLAPLVLLGLGLPLVQNLGRYGPTWDWFRERYEIWTAVWLPVTVLGCGFELLPALFAGHNWLVGLHPSSKSTLGPMLVPLVNGVLVVVTQRLPRVSRYLLELLWVSGPLAFLAFYLSLTRFLVQAQVKAGGGVSWWQIPIPVGSAVVPWWIILVIDVALIVYGYMFLNINLTSLHRFYRDRLASAYLLKPADLPKAPEPIANDLLKLSDLGAYHNAPYHLINAALNLAGSERSDLRGRNCDSFVFSKHFCGSPVLGYFPTKDWESLDGHLDLGTAVAISGAAAAPVMGMASIPRASFLLALLNVRLAYWLRSADPQKKPIWPSWSKILGRPGPLYLFREMFGRVDEKGRYVNVSDGGHLENLGIYELLRRRCKFIIAVDGECDPHMTCGSLTQVCRFASIDFGIDIQIRLSDLLLNSSSVSDAHFAVGSIKYPGEERGLLLYIKSSVTGNEPAYVLSYRALHGDFPHESTAKQLFNEHQFEAYRSLGFHVADALFRKELLLTDNPDALSFRDWFERLANSLL
jgi:hypothetical protein